MNRTFSIIKPDATKRNLIGAINKMIEENNLRIVAQKMEKLSKEKAEGFYDVHRDKPFFKDLIEYMISGTVVLQVLESEDAILKYREVMGSTNPLEAKEGTIRKAYGLNIQENSVHGSDSLDNANKEIKYFFDEDEIFS